LTCAGLRYAREDRDCHVIMAPKGADWNDVRRRLAA
jgi:hypothetical protein